MPEQEKRYLVTAITKGKKPKVLFLGSDFVWRDNAQQAIKCSSLEYAKRLAKSEPTYCAFIEAKNELLLILPTTQRIGARKFTKLVNKLNCEHCHNRPIKKQPETQAKETSEPQETPEEKREYVLYRYLGEGTDERRFYYSEEYEGAPYCIIGDYKAALFTKGEAQRLNNTIGGHYTWYHIAYGAFMGKLPTKETPAPEAKKRVAYVLRTLPEDGISFHYAGGRDDLGIYISSKKAKLYRTQDDAQFAADILNLSLCNTWQVEQIEF